MADDANLPQEGQESPGSTVRRLAKQTADDLGLTSSDYVKAALTWQYNWIGLIGAAAFALASGSGFPLVLAAGLELMYVSLVPQSSRFRRLVRSWKYAKERKEHEQRLISIYAELPPDLRRRYENLEKLCGAIRANYERLSTASQIFVRQMDERLAGLSRSYVRLLHAANHHREYLKTIEPEEIKREIGQIQKTLASDAAKVQEINRKRIEILEKRLQKFQRIGENQQVVDAQCSAIEEVLELIRDQTVTMRDPQQVSDQLDTLVQDVEQTEDTVRQVEAIFDIGAPEPGLPSALRESSAPPSRVPRRNRAGS